MAKREKRGLANVGGITQTGDQAVDAMQQNRQLVADLCRLLGATITGQTSTPLINTRVQTGLSPRVQQTLERLLAGDSEKQIAQHMGVSKHTVHVYVKALYRRFKVSSRGELLAHFVQPPRFIPSDRRAEDVVA